MLRLRNGGGGQPSNGDEVADLAEQLIAVVQGLTHDVVDLPLELLNVFGREFCGGHDDNRDRLPIGSIPDRGDKLAPIDRGDHQVQEDEIGRIGLELAQGILTAGGRQDLPTLVPEHLVKVVSGVIVILDDQDPRRRPIAEVLGEQFREVFTQQGFRHIFLGTKPKSALPLFQDAGHDDGDLRRVRLP